VKPLLFSQLFNLLFTVPRTIHCYGLGVLLGDSGIAGAIPRKFR
jgi:hypothetical protein